MKAPARARAGAGGFTLAEVAVTIVIVGIGLVLVLQGLNAAKLTAAHTRNSKVARELGLLVLGRIEAGLYQEEIDDLDVEQSFAEEGYPEFTFEVALGDESFLEIDEFDPNDPRSRAAEEERLRQQERDEDELDEDEEATQPYEMVQVRVRYPKIEEFPDSLILERWIPWEQVYGRDEEAEEAAAAAGSAGGAGAAPPGGSPR